MKPKTHEGHCCSAGHYAAAELRNLLSGSVVKLLGSP